jgi:hypothetical protein
MAKKGWNMYEVYHTLFIIVSTYSAAVGIYIYIFFLVSYLTAQNMDNLNFHKNVCNHLQN